MKYRVVERNVLKLHRRFQQIVFGAALSALRGGFHASRWRADRSFILAYLHGD